MKITNRLTDEKLASLIEEGSGKNEMEFSDISVFEAASVVENALSLIDEGEIGQESWYDISCFDYEPLAMCGFLGDEAEDEYCSYDRFDAEVSSEDDVHDENGLDSDENQDPI